jgi:zinc transport system ATP-binding protein
MADKDTPSIIFSRDDTILFTTTGRWLYPLFELKAFLKMRRDIPVAQCHLHDRLIGKAAALLIVGLGIRSVSTEVLSQLGKEVFLQRNIPIAATTEVDRIACATEELLRDVDDPAEAWRRIRERVNERSSL